MAKRAKAQANGKSKVRLTECECGCSKPTRNPGAHFLPGHDAKLKSALKTAVLEGSARQAKEARAELARRNWTRLVKLP